MEINKTKNALAVENGLMNKPNVIAISEGTKVVNGIDTGEKCVVIEVEKKVPLSELSSSELIPKFLSDNETKTDIIESFPIFATGVCPDHSGSNTASCSGHGGKTDGTLLGGVQIGPHFGGWVGTFGAIARDNIDNKLVCLTNAHVTALAYDPSAGYNWSTSPAGTYTGPNPPDYNQPLPASNWNCCPPVSGSDPTTAVYMNQPGGTWFPGAGGNSIGPVKRTVPIRFRTTQSFIPNYVDASIITITPSNSASLVLCPMLQDSAPLGTCANILPLFDFNDIDDINDTNICIKVGRTSGRTPRPGDLEYIVGQKATITNNDKSITVGYASCTAEVAAGTAANSGINPWSATFLHTLEIQLSCVPGGTQNSFSNSGDSGSLVYIYHNCQWKILGLLFAGGGGTDPCEKKSYVCRIDYVMKELDIGEGWTNDSSYHLKDGGTISQSISANYTTILPDVSASGTLSAGALWDGSIVLHRDQFGGDVDKWLTITYQRQNNVSGWSSDSIGGTPLIYQLNKTTGYSVDGKEEVYDDITFSENISANNLLAGGSGGITDNVISWTAHSNIGESSLAPYTTAGPGLVNHLDIGLLDTGDSSIGHNGVVYYVNPRSSGGSNTIGSNYKNVMNPELFFLRNTSYYLHLCAGLEWNGSHPFEIHGYQEDGTYIPLAKEVFNTGGGIFQLVEGVLPTSSWNNISYMRYTCGVHGDSMGNIIRVKSRC